MGGSGGTILGIALVVGIGVAIWKRCEIFPDMCKGGGKDPVTGSVVKPIAPPGSTVVLGKPIPITKDQVGNCPKGSARNCKPVNGRIECSQCESFYTRVNSRFTRLAI